MTPSFAGVLRWLEFRFAALVIVGMEITFCASVCLHACMCGCGWGLGCLKCFNSCTPTQPPHPHHSPMFNTTASLS